MDYAECMELIRKGVSELPGLTEEKVHLKRAGEEPITTEDVLLIFMREEDDCQTFCHIPLESTYRRIIQGTPLGHILCELETELHSEMNKIMFKESLAAKVYEVGRDMIRIRAVPMASVEEKDVVVELVGDIAVVPYLYLSGDRYEAVTSKITTDMLAHWKKDEKDIMEIAMKNMNQYEAPCLISLLKVLVEPGYMGDIFMDDKNYKFHQTGMATCISTINRINGASAIFCAGVKERIAEFFDSSFYIAFTSRHECMVHKEDQAKPETLKEILKMTIDRGTEEGDLLSYNIFYYDKETRKMTQV